MRPSLGITDGAAARKYPAHRSILEAQPVLLGELVPRTHRLLDAACNPFLIVRMHPAEELRNRGPLRGPIRIDGIERREARIAIDKAAPNIPVPGADPAAGIERELQTLVRLAQLAFERDAAGRLDGGDQDAADAGRRGLVAHRAVAHGEIRILRRLATAADVHQQIFEKDCAALAGKNLRMQRPQLILHLGPRLAEWQA